MQNYTYEKAMAQETRNGGTSTLNNNNGIDNSKRKLLIGLDIFCLLVPSVQSQCDKGEIEQVSGEVGKSIILQTGRDGQTGARDLCFWSTLPDNYVLMSNTPDLLLNESQGTPSWICKLRERIHLDPVSGSLTITDLSLNDTRLYCGQVWKKTGSFHRFNVTILDPQPGADWNIDSPIPWVIGVVLFLCLCLLGVLATYFLFKQKRNIGVVNNQEGTRQVRGSGGTSGDQPEQPGMPLLDKVVVGGEKQTGEPILPPADAEERSTESPIQVAGEGEGQTTQ